VFVEGKARLGTAKLKRQEIEFKGLFVVSPWIIAYLMQYRLLRLTDIDMNEQAVKIYGKDLDGADGVVGSIDALSHMLGFEEDEPGLSLCKGIDLQLDEVTVEFRAEHIRDLDWVLALGSKECVITLVGSVPKITSESGARFPATESIVIRAPPTEKSVGEESLEGWTPLLNHIIASCPELTDLYVEFELSREDLLRSSLNVMAKFRDSVFPRLPQETETMVWVKLIVTMQTEEYEALIREHGEYINRTFDKQGDAEICAGFAPENTQLWREVHWERGEELDMWGVSLFVLPPVDDD